MIEVNKSDAMIITLNGEKREVPEGLTVDGLLEFLKISKESVTVQHNGVVLKQKQHTVVRVGEGNVLEIVKFVEGG